MSKIFIYIFSAACFLAFLLTSYISLAWAQVRKAGLAADGEEKVKIKIKPVLQCAASQRKTLKVVDWLTILISAIAATAALVAALLPNENGLQIHVIFSFKIAVSLILLLSAGIVDAKTHTIPNLLPAAFLIARIIFLPFEYIFQRENFKTLIISSLAGLAATFIILYLVHRLTKSGFGMGDVKILSALGFMFSISCTLSTVLFGMIITAVIGIVLIIMKKKTRKDAVPFGPFIFIGFIISVILGVY